MGGSGSGPTLPPDDLRKLEQTAKERLRQAAQDGKVNVFISFASEDLNEVNLLRAQAKNDRSELEFNDWSLREPFDSNRAEYIKRGIRERIRQASLTVVYVSEHTPSSKWVDWEIRESLALGKRVIATHKGDSPPSRLPQAIVEYGIQVIPWSRLADAINKQLGRR